MCDEKIQNYDVPTSRTRGNLTDCKLRSAQRSRRALIPSTEFVSRYFLLQAAQRTTKWVRMIERRKLRNVEDDRLFSFAYPPAVGTRKRKGGRKLKRQGILLFELLECIKGNVS